MKRIGCTRHGLMAMLAASVLGQPIAASAGLGDPVAQVGADQAKLKGARRQSAAAGPQTQAHDIVMPDGSRITEYAGPDGTVFAVAWNTRFKPNVDLLLGRYAATFAVAARDAMKTPGMKRRVLLQRDDLVVQSSGHLNSFVGRAYLRSRVPAGFGVDALR